MRVVTRHLQRFRRQTKILVSVWMYQLPDHDPGREQTVAPRHRTLERSDLRPVLLEILMRVPAMPGFLEDVNLRQFTHHRMALRILRGAAVQVADYIFGGERTEHDRHSRGQVLADKSKRD